MKSPIQRRLAAESQRNWGLGLIVIGGTLLALNLALLAVGGRWWMTAAQAVVAAMIVVQGIRMRHAGRRLIAELERQHGVGVGVQPPRRRA